MINYTGQDDGLVYKEDGVYSTSVHLDPELGLPDKPVRIWESPDDMPKGLYLPTQLIFHPGDFVGVDELPENDLEWRILEERISQQIDIDLHMTSLHPNRVEYRFEARSKDNTVLVQLFLDGDDVTRRFIDDLKFYEENVEKTGYSVEVSGNEIPSGDTCSGCPGLRKVPSWPKCAVFNEFCKRRPGSDIPRKNKDCLDFCETVGIDTKETE